MLNLRKFRVAGSAALGFAFFAGAAATLTMDGSLRYPLGYSQTLIVLTALLFFVAAALAQRERAMPLPAGAPVASGTAGGPAALVGVIVLCIVYVLSWGVVGYFLSTFFFVAAQLLVMRQRRWLILVCLPLATTFVVYVVFYRLLQLPFPAGILFD